MIPMKRAAAWLRSKWTREERAAVAGAYAALFAGGNDGGELVLADLRKFCFVDDSTMEGAGSDREVFAAEGMRAVYLHIRRVAGLEPADLLAATEEGL